MRLLFAAKDPVRVEAGRIGARKRWGEPRVVRLDELNPDQRRLIHALIDAAKEAVKAPAATTASAPEVTGAEITATSTD